MNNEYSKLSIKDSKEKTYATCVVEIFQAKKTKSLFALNLIRHYFPLFSKILYFNKHHFNKIQSDSQ